MSEFDSGGLLEGYDDAPASVGNREKRIQAFMKQVDRQTKIARARKKVDAKQRIEAIRWLGESGEPTAIKTLVTLYEKDNTPGIKEASAYALGQFRALEVAMEDPDTAEYAQDLLQEIILEGRMGKKAKPSKRVLFIINALLALTFILAIGAMLALAPPTTPTLTPTRIAAATAPPEVMTDISADLLAQYQALDSDSRTLQTQLLTITRDEAPDCNVTFANPAAYTLPAGIADETLIAVATLLEESQASIANVRNAYTASCDAAISIPPPQALTYSDTIVEVQRNLSTIPALLNIDPLAIPDPLTEATEESLATVTPDASPTPDIPPTATIDAAAIDIHISSLRFNIEEMNSFRGHNTLLLQYWTDVSISGSTGGCLNLPAPTLPLDYSLPEADLAIAPQELLDAIDGYNLGMSLSRQSWQAFSDACATNTLSDVVAVQLLTAQTAQGAFNTATTQLETLLFGGTP